MPKTYLIITLLLTTILSGCGNDTTYTLYRNSIPDENMRIYIATFDSPEMDISGSPDAYNSGNCNTAAKLFQSQPGTKTKFWCEKGSYRK